MVKKKLKNIIAFTACVLLGSMFFRANAQTVNNLTPVPYQVIQKEGVYRFEGEPKVRYIAATPGSMPPESYRLRIDKKGVTITSADPAGAFYAKQTLAQLIHENTLPYCEIYDFPRFPYRGVHFDVSRHFRSIDFLKKQIDAMAMFKMNRMHIHLTDAAGWRLQIDAYPKLTEFAAWRPQHTWKEWWAGNRH